MNPAEIADEIRAFAPAPAPDLSQVRTTSLYVDNNNRPLGIRAIHATQALREPGPVEGVDLDGMQVWWAVRRMNAKPRPYSMLVELRLEEGVPAMFTSWRLGEHDAALDHELRS